MRVSLLALVCAIALAGPARAADPTPSEPAAPNLTEEERQLLFQAYHSAMASGDRSGAADTLVGLMKDEKHGQEVEAEAIHHLGTVFAELDLEYAAVLAWSRNSEWSATDVQAALDLGEKVGDEDVIIKALLQRAGAVVEEGQAAPAEDPRVAYLEARYLLRHKKYDESLAFADQVPAGTDWFVDAQMLKGILLANQGKHAVALAPLLTAQAAGTDRDDAFQDLMNLNVARAYYGADNWAQAIQHYAQIHRKSKHWPEVQFERGWAHFRAEDMNGALSSLENLRSGFFEDWYYPEADLLRGYALFMMCKFPSAGDQLDAFQARYEPVKARLDEAAAITPEEAFNDVRAFRKGEPTQLPPHVLQRFALEDQFIDAIAAVERADDELDRLGNVTSYAFPETAETWLQKRRTEVMNDEGARVLGTALKARAELGKMLGDIEISRLDILRYETQLYERAAATGDLEYGDRIGKLRKIRKSRRTWVWPFEGEYWADELGWYKVDARPDCPDGGLASGGTP